MGGGHESETPFSVQFDTTSMINEWLNKYLRVLVNSSYICKETF